MMQPVERPYINLAHLKKCIYDSDRGDIHSCPPPLWLRAWVGYFDSRTCTALHSGDALAGNIQIPVSFTGGQPQDIC